MGQAVISLPSNLAAALKLTERELGRELAFLAAAKLFELGRCTASQAAQLAGLDRWLFLSRLATIGVPAINLRDEEIDEEIAAARALAS